MEDATHTQMDNLSEILIRIQQAETTTQIAAAYKSASATLRQQLKSSDKHIEEHDTAREELADLLQDFEQTQSSMSLPGTYLPTLRLSACVRYMMACARTDTMTLRIKLTFRARG